MEETPLGGAECAEAASSDAGRDPANSAPPKPTAAAPAVVFKKLRREKRPISPPQPNLFRTRFGSHTSRAFRISSQVISRPVDGSLRAIIPENARSAPLYL